MKSRLANNQGGGARELFCLNNTSQYMYNIMHLYLIQYVVHVPNKHAQ